MKKILAHLSNNCKSYIVAFVISFLICLAYLLYVGFNQYIFYVNATAFAGLILFFISLLLLVGNLGAFDIFTYSFIKVTNRKKYDSMADFIEDKSVTRAKNKYFFVPFLSVSLFFILISILLMLFL